MDLPFLGLLGDAFGGASASSGDQAAMQAQQGFYYRPDAIQSGNAPWAQPTGYSGLTPDQIQAVQQQGYYTGGGQQPESLWDKLRAGLGTPGAGDALKKITEELGGKPYQSPASPISHGAIGAGGGNPYFNIYRHISLDPRAALKSLMGGNL